MHKIAILLARKKYPLLITKKPMEASIIKDFEFIKSTCVCEFLKDNMTSFSETYLVCLKLKAIVIVSLRANMFEDVSNITSAFGA